MTEFDFKQNLMDLTINHLSVFFTLAYLVGMISILGSGG